MSAPSSAPPERVLVAMSGGVDSSVAAALVVRSGAEAIGVTLHLAGSASRCCSLDDVDDARRVADALGVRFYVANLKQRFRSEIMEPFAAAYLAGETPIPCVACNKRFKFDAMFERANAFGASRVATGHFARIDRDPSDGHFRLRQAKDLSKDQSYFLHSLSQAQLARSWFPLGELTKAEVRELARELELATAEKAESHEICFVPQGHYADVVEALRPESAGASGEIVDRTGQVLGQHRGIHRYTVGQRRGLGIASNDPLYVTAVDAASQRVVVGPRSALDARGAIVREVSWIRGQAPDATVRARVHVRYRHAGTEASVEPVTSVTSVTSVTGESSKSSAGDVVRVRFDAPVSAVTPGQAAVFYQDDVVLGGGTIREAVA